MYVTHEEIEDDLLFKETFQYWFNEQARKLTFHSYTVSTRPTKRHKFRVQRYWCRIHQRDNTMSKPQVSEVIKQEVFNKFVNSITI